MLLPRLAIDEFYAFFLTRLRGMPPPLLLNVGFTLSKLGDLFVSVTVSIFSGFTGMISVASGNSSATLGTRGFF